MDSQVMWSPGMKLEVLEKLCIEKAFRFYHNNKTATANSLGISIRTLDNKLEKYEMEGIENEASNTRRKQEREDHLRRARGEPVQYDTAATPKLNTYVPKTKTRVGLQPIANASTQQPVSMQERAEVQEVLPGHTSRDSARSKR